MVIKLWENLHLSFVNNVIEFDLFILELKWTLIAEQIRA